MILSLVGGIGYTSVLSSLHQFITNGISKDSVVAAAQQSVRKAYLCRESLSLGILTRSLYYLLSTCTLGNHLVSLAYSP